MYMDLDRVINSMVEAILPRYSAPDIVLYVPVDITLFNHDKADENGEGWEFRTHVSFLFHRYSNYTKVFYLTQERIGEFSFSTMYKRHIAEKFADKWDLIGYHDSCWRDSVSRKLREVQEELEERSGLSSVLPHQTFISFGITGPHLCFAEVRHVREESGKYSIVVTGNVPERSNAAEYVVSTCPLEELPLLINYKSPTATFEQNRRVQDIAKQRLQTNKKVGRA